jgi:hypothetical protein
MIIGVAESYRPYHTARRSRLVPELEAAERLKARRQYPQIEIDYHPFSRMKIVPPKYIAAAQSAPMSV